MEKFQLLTLIGILLMVIGLVWYYINKNGFRQSIIDLILKAQKTSLENSEKMNYVIDRFILLLPTPIQFIVTRNFINSITENF